MAATLANTNRRPGTPAYKPTDFMPWQESVAEEAEPEQDERDKIFKLMGGD